MSDHREESQPTLACARCGGATQIGFIPDYSYGAILQAGWYPGKPQEGWFGNSLKVRRESVRSIVAYRCESCGPLDLYA